MCVEFLDAAKLHPACNVTSLPALEGITIIRTLWQLDTRHSAKRKAPFLVFAARAAGMILTIYRSTAMTFSSRRLEARKITRPGSASFLSTKKSAGKTYPTVPQGEMER